MSLNTNITNLQEILDKVNNLPNSEPQENLEEELNTQSILLEEQNTKIAELADALANKASSGSGENIKYDTCTIYLSPLGGKLFGYCATCFDGENILYKYDFSSNGLGSVTIRDVICGSAFSIIQEVTSGYVKTSSNLVKIYSNNGKGSIFTAPTEPEAYAEIDIGNLLDDNGGHSGGAVN